MKCRDCDEQAVGIMAVCSQCARRIVEEGKAALRRCGASAKLLGDFEKKVQADAKEAEDWKPHGV